MNLSLIVIILLVAAVLCIIVLGKKQANPEQQAPRNSEGNNSTEDPENDIVYQWGLHPGEDGQTVMYTLSSCRHCVSVKKWLQERDIPFHEVYVDKYFGEQRVALMAKLQSYNPRSSFPTTVLPDGKRCVVGFRVKQLSQEFGKE